MKGKNYSTAKQRFLCWMREREWERRKKNPSTTRRCELRGHKWDMDCGGGKKRKRMTVMSGWKPPFVPSHGEIPRWTLNELRQMQSEHTGQRSCMHSCMFWNSLCVDASLWILHLNKSHVTEARSVLLQRGWRCNRVKRTPVSFSSVCHNYTKSPASCLFCVRTPWCSCTVHCSPCFLCILPLWLFSHSIHPLTFPFMYNSLVKRLVSKLCSCFHLQSHLFRPTYR